MNAKHLPADFSPMKGALEQDFKVSFLLPVGPLTFEDLGKLNADTGCFVCGKKTASLCAQCFSVSYCGQDCQRAHWPEHKGMCRSVRGGTWRTVPFVNIMPGHEGHSMYMLTRHNFKDSEVALRNPDETRPPPNIHGTKIFLVKLQIVIPARDFHMVYDRQRSFGEVYFLRTKSPEVFSEMISETEGPRGGFGGYKMYRLAKRVSDWELSICLDREPQSEIMW
ncbi:hypothetical protein BKA93DRAFT_259447 [Sparassis latifolia]